ncbi:hypothetical protein BASA81_011423 [Batrachochytrium salamandrivorans]|nr:hypothetical protein BASA81_011423 [Batrachochytrium salamandrivorans]
MFLGQLVNEAINLVLKVSIKQARPTDHLGDGYGMPSSHAQFIWFFAVYASLYTTYRLNFRYTIWKPIIVSGLITSATIVAYSRVRLQYHSIEQVAVGSALGVCVGFFWYIVVQYMLFPLADRLGIVEGWMGRLFLLRDTRKTGSLLVVQREWMGLFNHGAPAISKPKSE